MKFFSLLIIFLMMTGLLFAQKTISDTTLLKKQLQDVVVTAQFAPQLGINAIYKVKVLHASSIHHKGATNLSELLQEEMSIDLSQNSVFGSNVEIQGISKENIKILIDGVPVIGRLNGIIDLSQINLSNVERVEIIEGPVSIFYGTDAMGGIMNLVTKKNQSAGVEGDVSISYESINAVTTQGNIGYRFGKSLLRLNGGIYRFGGLSTLDSTRSVNWPKRNDYFGDLLFSRDLMSLKLRYNAHLSKHTLYSLGDPDRYGKIKDADYFTRRIDNTVSLSGNVWRDKYLDVTASYLDYQRFHDTYNVDSNLLRVLSEKDTRSKNIVQYQYAGVKMNIGKSNNADKLNYLIGADVNLEASSGERILDKKQTISTVALFASINYKVLKIIELQPGLRYTWNSAYGSLPSPAINAKLNLRSDQKLRFSYARGFRAPTIKELYLDFHIGPFVISGNEDLEVEKSHSFNMQYSLNANLGGKKSLLIEPSVFYNTISNLIDLSVLKDSKRYYLNVDKFKSVGGRVNLTYVPTSSLVVGFGYGNTGRYNRFSEKNDSEEILFTPEATTSIGYYSKKHGLHLNAYFKYSGKRKGFYIDRVTKKIKETVKDDFNNLTIIVSKDFFQEKVNAQLGGKNLFDVKDVEITHTDGSAHSHNLQLWGRSFYAKATLNF